MEHDNANKVLKEKPEFSYDSDINILDIMANPEIIINKVEQAVILCHNCKKPLTIRFRKYYITIKCGCGTRIFYPKGEKNYYDSRYISAEVYFKNKIKF